MVHSFKRTVRPRPSVIFNVFLDKLKPIWNFLAADELPKRGSVRQETHFYGQKSAYNDLFTQPCKASFESTQGLWSTHGRGRTRKGSQ